jgi:uncharacterized protein involved in exopolysaccharide biosynthesis
MDLAEIIRIVRRWAWLILTIIVVAQLALWLGVRAAPAQYKATVGVQISAPQVEDVAAYDQYRSITLRDEITAAINNFTDILTSDEVIRRTTQQLGLTGDNANYTVSAERVLDADYINMTVQAATPALAAQIANTHVAVATAYYGELRAQSTKADRDLFAKQLADAQQEYVSAQSTYAAFQSEHGITSMDGEIDRYKQILAQLSLQRDQQQVQRVTTIADPVAEVDKLIAQRQQEMDRLQAMAPTYHLLQARADQARTRYESLSAQQYDMTQPGLAAAARGDLPGAERDLTAAEKALSDYQAQNGAYSLDAQVASQQKLLENLQAERDKRVLEKTTAVSDPVAEVDKVISQRQAELDQLYALAPQYNILSQKLTQAQDNYQHLLSKYNEAVVKVSAVQAASFIQVVNPATAPQQADSNWKKLALLAFAGTLGLGIVLAFLLDSLFPQRQYSANRAAAG